MTPDEVIEKFLDECAKHVGLSESPKGSNNGKALREFLKGSGFSPGQPWCAYAMWAVGNKALGSAWPLPRTGDCDVLLRLARKRGVLHTKPKHGDIFLVCATFDDATHTGAVRTPDYADDSFSTYEGNSNGGGSREGWQFTSRPERAIDPKGRYVCKFLRWVDLLDLEKEADPVQRAPTALDTVSFPVRIGAQGGILSGLRVPQTEGDRDVKTYIPVRLALTLLHGKTFVDANMDILPSGQLTWVDKLMIGMPIFRGGVAYLWVRDFAKLQGLQVKVEPEMVTLYR